MQGHIKSHLIYTHSVHCEVPCCMYSSVWLMMSYSFAQVPQSNSDLFIYFQDLHYFLLVPICNGWRVALKSPLSLSQQIERREGKKKNPWENPDLWSCDCNALSGEGSQREDYTWQAVPNYHFQSRGAQESQTATETQPEQTEQRNVLIERVGKERHIWLQSRAVPESGLSELTLTDASTLKRGRPWYIQLCGSCFFLNS